MGGAYRREDSSLSMGTIAAEKRGDLRGKVSVDGHLNSRCGGFHIMVV